MDLNLAKFIQTIFITARINLVLIPKVNPETVHQLRPISLCNPVY